MSAPTLEERGGIRVRSWGSPDADHTVAAFPPAGADSRTFDALAEQLTARHPRVRLVAFDPPGRGPIPRPTATGVHGYALRAAQAIREITSPTTQLTVYGHSFGGYVALETTRALIRSGRPKERLRTTLLATAPAHRLVNFGALLNGDTWVESLSTLGGTPKEVLKSPFFQTLYLPLIRGDLLLGLAYLEGGPSFSDLRGTDIDVVAAAQDPMVTANDMADWLEVLPDARFQVLPTEHFPKGASLSEVVTLLTSSAGAEAGHGHR